MSKKIALFDIGHGGGDSGAVQVTTGRKESADVLRLYLRIKYFLSKCDLILKATRETDIAVKLQDRPAYANKINADIMVSLHRNSGKYGETTANGVEIWVHPQAPAVDTTIAKDMLERLAKVGIQSNRGIKYGSYVVLTCKAPAVMVELGFMNNIKDNQLLDSKLDQYAKAIAESVCVSLGVPFIDPSNPTTPPPVNPNQLYRIQLGAFASAENAENYLKQIKELGLEAYLVRPSTERVEKE